MHTVTYHTVQETVSTSSQRRSTVDTLLSNITPVSSADTRMCIIHSIFSAFSFACAREFIGLFLPGQHETQLLPPTLLTGSGEGPTIKPQVPVRGFWGAW